MKKTIFEEVSGTYTQVGDYFLPDLKLPEEATKANGIWGQRHTEYLKENYRILYYNLLAQDKRNAYFHDIDIKAKEQYDLLIKQFSENQGVTE